MTQTRYEWLAWGTGGVLFAFCAVCGLCTTTAAVLSAINDSSLEKYPTAAPAFPELDFATAEPPLSVTAEPTALAEAATVPPPDAAAFESGGLGLARAEWEARHEESSLAYEAYGTGYDGIFDVIFQQDRIWYIERQWSQETPITPEQAEAESVRLIPPDSRLVETYSPEDRPETVVHVYSSELLKNQFGGDWWNGGEPGTFTVQYSVYEFGVWRLAITLGNGPPE